MTQQWPRSSGTTDPANAGGNSFNPAAQSPGPAHAQAPSPAASGGEVFLTPRVVDQAAFDELSTSLKHLVQTAARQSADLRAAVAQADRLRVQMQGSEQSQQENLALAAEAVKRIEQRAREAESLLEKARTALPSAEEFEKRAEELVTRRLGMIEAKLDAMTAAAIAKAENAERRIADVSTGLERRIEELGKSEAVKLGSAMQRLEEVIRRAEALASDARPTDGPNGEPAKPTLSFLVKRAEALTDQTSFANNQLDAIRKQADQARAILGESLNDMCTMIDRLSERGEALRQEAERAKRTASEVGREVDERVASARAGMESTAKSIEDLGLGVRVAEGVAMELRRLLAQLEPWEALVRPGAEAEEVPAPVREMIARSQDAARRELATIADALRRAAGRIEADSRGEVEPLTSGEVMVKSVRRERAELAGG